MYVCVCNAVTDRDIRRAADRGVTTLEQLSIQLKVATCCGRCESCARRVLDQALNDQFDAAPDFALSPA